MRWKSWEAEKLGQPSFCNARRSRQAGCAAGLGWLRLTCFRTRIDVCIFGFLRFLPPPVSLGLSPFSLSLSLFFLSVFFVLARAGRLPGHSAYEDPPMGGLPQRSLHAAPAEAVQPLGRGNCVAIV